MAVVGLVEQEEEEAALQMSLRRWRKAGRRAIVCQYLASISGCTVLRLERVDRIGAGKLGCCHFGLIHLLVLQPCVQPI